MSFLMVPSSLAATNVDSLNRSFVHTADVENGTPMICATRSVDEQEFEVFTVGTPAAGDTVWVAFEAEVVNTVTPNGNVYRNIDPDARNFINPAGVVFSGFMPQVADIMKFDATNTSIVPARVGTNEYLNVDVGNMAYVWSATPAIDTLSMKLVEESYISIGNGALGDLQRVNAYIFEVVNN